MFDRVGLSSGFVSGECCDNSQCDDGIVVEDVGEVGGDDENTKVE